MTDFTLAPVQIDKDKLRFDIFKYASDAVTVLLLEKDKGGTGATGTAMSIVELLLFYGIAVHIVDFADTQLDLEMAYKDVDGISVHRPEEETGGEEGCVLRAIAAAQPAEVVVVQFPATATARIERVHRLLVHAQARADMNIHTSIIWTMDRDRNSRDLLEAALKSALPGPLHVNWPTWNGAVQIEPELRRTIAAQGGKVFAMPGLDDGFYQPFKSQRIAPRTAYLNGDIVARMQIDLWLHGVADALGARQ